MGSPWPKHILCPFVSSMSISERQIAHGLVEHSGALSEICLQIPDSWFNG